MTDNWNKMLIWIGVISAIIWYVGAGIYFGTEFKQKSVQCQSRLSDFLGVTTTDIGYTIQNMNERAEQYRAEGCKISQINYGDDYERSDITPLQAPDYFYVKDGISGIEILKYLGIILAPPFIALGIIYLLIALTKWLLNWIATELGLK